MVIVKYSSFQFLGNFFQVFLLRVFVDRKDSLSSTAEAKVNGDETQQTLTLNTPKRTSLPRRASDDSRVSSTTRENVPLSQRTRNVTLAFFLVSLFFICSVAPYMVMTTIQSLILGGQTSSCTLKSLFIIAQILFLLHFVTNPLIYLTTCATFRRKLKEDLEDFKTRFSCNFCNSWMNKKFSRSCGGVGEDQSVQTPAIGVTPPSVANEQSSTKV